MRGDGISVWKRDIEEDLNVLFNGVSRVCAVGGGTFNGVSLVCAAGSCLWSGAAAFPRMYAQWRCQKNVIPTPAEGEKFLFTLKTFRRKTFAHANVVLKDGASYVDWSQHLS